MHRMIYKETRPSVLFCFVFFFLLEYRFGGLFVVVSVASKGTTTVCHACSLMVESFLRADLMPGVTLNRSQPSTLNGSTALLFGFYVCCT